MNERPRSSPAAFPSTHWTVLRADPAARSRTARDAFEALAQRYWRPVAAYVRARTKCSDEDAADRTQEFFLWMLESGFLERADPERGRFRAFLKTSLQHFLTDRSRRASTQRRGGDRALLSLSGRDEHGLDLDVADPSRDPDRCLDELWRRTLLEEAQRALEKELNERGKSLTYALFRDFYLGEEDLDYEALANRHGVRSSDVSNHLVLARKRYRALLRAAVLETVHADEDLRAELRWLFEENAG